MAKVRVAMAATPKPDTALYHRLSRRHERLLGPATSPPSAHTAPTRGGQGILFVAHNGEVYPAGFLPLGIGDIRDRSLQEIYRNDPLLGAIRATRFTGRCGRCEWADLCGGSRVRAYAASGDPLGEDPVCPYEPLGYPARDESLWPGQGGPGSLERERGSVAPGGMSLWRSPVSPEKAARDGRDGRDDL